tara:strand:- start:827 stop:1474 length:648 start_codon:yes stop_codon:yes gene_type:complete
MDVNIKKDGKKHKYKIKEWKELTLEKWAEVIAINKGSNVQQAVENIRLISDIPKKLIEQLTVKDVAFILEKATEVQKEGKLKHKITMHDIDYGFHPNLEAITIGEYADIEQYVSNGLEENMHNIMAVLYRPIVAEDKDNYTIAAYDSDKFEDRAEVFKKMKAKDVNSALVFFWTLGNELLTILPQFLANLQKDLETKMQEILPKINSQVNGAGFQ